MDGLAGLTERVAATVARERLLAPAGGTLVMISGGADSTFLLHALVRLGYDCEALHAAHALRGAQSELDAEACATLAAGLGVPLRRIDAAVSGGAGVEGRARDARRAAGDEHARGRPIATGHTSDDRVETILYRLAASPGRAAFAALPASDGAGRVRPLIDLRRDEIRAALRESGIAWREDESNHDRTHARNRVRHDLLPAFRTLHPTAERNLLATATALAAEQEALDATAAALLDSSLHELDVARAAAAPPAIARHAVRLLAGKPAPGHAALQRAIDLLQAQGGTARAPLGAGRSAERRYGRLRVVRDAPQPRPPAPVRPAVPGCTPFGSYLLRIESDGHGDALDVALAPQLRVRAARPGDRIAGRRSTVARMLLDARVPAPQRPLYPVVEAAGELVCLPGIATAPAHARERGIVVRLEGP